MTRLSLGCDSSGIWEATVAAARAANGMSGRVAAKGHGTVEPHSYNSIIIYSGSADWSERASRPASVPAETRRPTARGDSCYRLA